MVPVIGIGVLGNKGRILPIKSVRDDFVFISMIDDEG
jgi:hypothetical protein